MDGLTRNAIKSKRKIWPNCKVPYVISSSYSSYERSVIASAMSEYHEKTCIKYVIVFSIFVIIFVLLILLFIILLFCWFSKNQHENCIKAYLVCKSLYNARMGLLYKITFILKYYQKIVMLLSIFASANFREYDLAKLWLSNA